MHGTGAIRIGGLGTNSGMNRNDSIAPGVGRLANLTDYLKADIRFIDTYTVERQLMVSANPVRLLSTQDEFDSPYLMFDSSAPLG